MIHHLDPEKFYSNRSYLTQWFHRDTLVVTDNDFQDYEKTKQLLGNQQYIVDITHNPYHEEWLQLDSEIFLTNNFRFWYEPSTKYRFFPLFLWMYSLRTNLWWSGFSFDSGSDKTQGLMCLNNRPRPHRTWLWNKFNQRSIIDKMVFTFTMPDSAAHRYSWKHPLLLPDEQFDVNRNDIGVEHSVYSNCAVNLVTETCTDFTYVSEKTCKPFVARQIPILVSCQGVNRFLSDIGLDMFEDLIPWRTWDDESDDLVRLEKISNFVESWINSGTMLDDYRSVLNRVEKNKTYFHSEQFRTVIMRNML
jgi:hypothetical protein